LNQIVTNLIRNACKFTDSGGQVSISLGAVRDETTPELGMAVLRVRDTGIGMDPEIVSTRLCRYYRFARQPWMPPDCGDEISLNPLYGQIVRSRQADFMRQLEQMSKSGRHRHGGQK
jgi:light-regulated signal transduction histidine kinase (bacteriophytochrome)